MAHGRSKRYKSEIDQAGKEVVGLKEGLEKIKSFSSVKFDQTVEGVINLGVA